MSHPLQWHYDLQDVLDVQELLQAALTPFEDRPICGRAVTDARNTLDRVCREFATSSMEDEAPDAYCCLVDALAFLNITLRLPFVDRRHVRMAADRLERFMESEVIS